MEDGKYKSTDLNNEVVVRRFSVAKLMKFALMRPQGLKEVLVNYILSKNWN